MDENLTVALTAALGAVAGFVGGGAYFAALARGVAATVAEGGHGRSAWMWHVGRVAGAVALFWLAATQGGVALIFTFAGFLLARHAVRRRIDRQGGAT